MRWHRTNRRFSGALALFALALQITLAFGHIHLRDFAGIPGVAAAAQANVLQPAGPDDADHSADNYCLVCATVNVANTLVAPDLAVLPVPSSSISTNIWHLCTADCGRIDHALFRARAPPLS
jgi:hypothetical protein